MIFKKSIYLIRCPIDMSVIYVGCTEDTYCRFISHCNRNNSNAPISEYIRDLRLMEMKPIFEIIETIENRECTYKEFVELKRIASDTEKHYIRMYYKEPNSRVLNVKSIS